MDVFVEQIVRRKADAATLLRKLAIIVGAVAVSAGVLILGLYTPIAISFFPGIFGVAVWLAIVFVRLQNIEYEYSFTNGDLDVDRIAGKKKRTRVTSVHVRSAELIAPLNERHQASYRSDTVRNVVDARTSASDTDCWFIRYQSNDGITTVLMFSPSERVLDAIERFAGRAMVRQ